MALLNLDLIHIAPAPFFSGFKGLNDRMMRGMEMLGRVAIGRTVATPDMTTGKTKPQMDPAAAGLETILATCGGRCYLLDFRDMLTPGHG
jgi:hypothetical protein